ncbi:helix-turn-helix transcriptional regulator [Coraliomargarita akajimensis]|uniref:Transcriptional regulator, AraC family n=1 Tax=Coraliomargarita akajimensis (strain DSM 45221 / IAM 15411 / JCM 23193 / KCTC 12865 / 04OKA010-24) TaxID=583355 RepID=D5EK94_CORAD|nr:AraC family transcriptional regulator [Coraliomargarita akajimensis]ADE54843.1 transcriptional regulator, AraC family [Coraliomargarita akajimensis DSM 45221]
MLQSKTGIQLSSSDLDENPACPFHPAQSLEWTDSAHICKSDRIPLKPGIDYLRIELSILGLTAWELIWEGDQLLLGFVESNWAKITTPGGDIEKLDTGTWFRTSGNKLRIDRCSSKSVRLHLILCSRQTTEQLLLLDPDNQHPVLSEYAQKGGNIPLHGGQMNSTSQSVAKQITQLRPNTIRDRLQLEAHALTWIAETLHQTVDAAAHANSAINANDRDAIQRIADAIKDAPGEEYSLQELCDIGRINEHKLKSAFKALYGKTAFSYLREIRMECAARLLQEDRLSVIQVANEVGYSNASHFARAFKEQHQLLPKAYQCLHRLKA